MDPQHPETLSHHLDIQPVAQALKSLNNSIVNAQVAQEDLEALENKENGAENSEDVNSEIEESRRSLEAERQSIRDQIPEAIHAMEELLRTLNELDLDRIDEAGEGGSDTEVEDDQQEEHDEEEDHGEYPMESTV